MGGLRPVFIPGLMNPRLLLIGVPDSNPKPPGTTNYTPLPETNSSHLKIDSLKFEGEISSWVPAFFQVRTVSIRESHHYLGRPQNHKEMLVLSPQNMAISGFPC